MTSTHARQRTTHDATLTDYLTREEAAELRGVGPDYLSTRLRDRLPPILPGRHPLWHRLQVLADLAGNPMPELRPATWLGDRSAVAAVLGIAPESVTHYLKRHQDTFPGQVKLGWYDLRDVAAWRREHPAGAGRPRRAAHRDTAAGGQ